MPHALNTTRKRIPLTLSSLIIALTIIEGGTAYAQEAATKPEAATEAESAPPPEQDSRSEKAPTVAEPEADLETPLKASTTSAEHSRVCLLGKHLGIEEADAQSAAALVCDAIHERDPQSQGPFFTDIKSQSRYRLDLHRLGQLIVVKLYYEEPSGTVERRKQMQLASIEEISTAAGRLAQAIVYNEKIEQTRRIDNLVALETEKPRSIESQFFWGLGINGAVAGGDSDYETSYGLGLLLQHQSERWAIGGHARFTGGDLIMANFGVGGRFFFLPNDISPFVGASLGLYALELDNGTTILDGGGLGAMAEVGIEILRFHTSRLGLALRADFPFFELDDGVSYGSVPTGDAYVVPLSLELYYLF